MVRQPSLQRIEINILNNSHQFGCMYGICSLAFTRLGKNMHWPGCFGFLKRKQKHACHYTIQVCWLQSTGSGGSTPSGKQGAVIQTLR